MAGWRSPYARQVAKAVRDAGGEVERTGKGRIRITGPSGTMTIQEPAGAARPDLKRGDVMAKIAAATGLSFG